MTPPDRPRAAGERWRVEAEAAWERAYLNAESRQDMLGPELGYALPPDYESFAAGWVAGSAAREEELREAVRMIAEVEWVGDEVRCPWCGGDEDGRYYEGHRPDCRRQSLLARHPAESGDADEQADTL